MPVIAGQAPSHADSKVTGFELSRDIEQNMDRGGESIARILCVTVVVS